MKSNNNKTMHAFFCHESDEVSKLSAFALFPNCIGNLYSCFLDFAFPDCIGNFVFVFFGLREQVGCSVIS